MLRRVAPLTGASSASKALAFGRVALAFRLATVPFCNPAFRPFALRAFFLAISPDANMFARTADALEVQDATPRARLPRLRNRPHGPRARPPEPHRHVNT